MITTLDGEVYPDEEDEVPASYGPLSGPPAVAVAAPATSVEPRDAEDRDKSGTLADEPESDPGRAAAGAWHLGWTPAMMAAAAAILLMGGRLSIRALLAMLLMALPGLIGALWRPQGRDRIWLIALWGAAGGMAASVEGGLSGPLAAFCIIPALAALVLDGPWLAGLAAAAAALALAAGLEATHAAPPAPIEALGLCLRLIGLGVPVLAAAGAWWVARQRTDRAVDAAMGEMSETPAPDISFAAAHAPATDVGGTEAERWQAVLGDLPELGLLLDAHGRTEAVFGRPPPGVDAHAFHAGLVEAASPETQAGLHAALDRAFAQGWAECVFVSLDGPPLRAAIQRMADGGASVILSPAPAARPAALSAGAAQATAPWADLSRRLAAAEAERDQAVAANEAKSRFLAGMSHELRTPLNAILGFSDIMRRRMFGELQPRYGEYADLIHEAGGHLTELINDVLDMAKIEARRYELSREVFDARDAVNAALRLMRPQADEAGVQLRGSLPSQRLMIDADRRALRQMVLNLTSNALKFTPRGGAVTVGASAADGRFVLVVSDTGMGISAEDLSRIGKPYEQAGPSADRAQGTGLGLSLVRALAELHGGTMTLESRLGEGTAVEVSMPVLAPGAGA